MRWFWIDHIIEHQPEQRMVAVKNVSRAEGYLHDYLVGTTPVMPFSLLIEGMAQTAGILVGTMSGFKEKVILAKIAKASLEEDVVPGDTVRFDASLDQLSASGAATSGVIDCRRPGSDAWKRIGRVELVFSHIDRNMSGTEFPEENFVFCDNFRLLLETAGLAELIA
ncbi:MAG: hypothetical protein QGH76_03455 [Phycisphaerales bacterium]|jgi:3-hydroxyacyl-[acyl-carrier-protein] dehydratase|nr:hypothetical protein [Phycisphaerales bacterium]